MIEITPSYPSPKNHGIIVLETAINPNISGNARNSENLTAKVIYFFTIS